MSACIEIQNLTKCYGSVVAVSGLNLVVEKGEAICLLGANGAGKTTTLYALAGTILPTTGTVRIFGKDARKEFVSIAGRIGFLPEKPAFFDFLTARENLIMAARLARKDITVDKALDRVGLLHVANAKVKTFSLGMRQRLGLAQAILTEPDLLILDEPFTGLDPECTTEMLKMLRSFVDIAKVTIVFSSHLLHEVETLADRVAVLNHGRLLACDQIHSVLAYDSSEVDVLVDSPAAAANRLASQPWVERVSEEPNLIRVRLKDATTHQLIVFLMSQGFVLLGVIPRRRTLRDYLMKVCNT